MAKTDNLSDFLTDVANSIRTKTGTTDPINAQDFSNKILSYQKKGEKDHNFMLYDINHALMNVVESWAMEQIYDFWSSSCEDDEEDDEIE